MLRITTNSGTQYWVSWPEDKVFPAGPFGSIAAVSGKRDELVMDVLNGKRTLWRGKSRNGVDAVAVSGTSATLEPRLPRKGERMLSFKVSPAGEVQWTRLSTPIIEIEVV